MKHKQMKKKKTRRTNNNTIGSVLERERENELNEKNENTPYNKQIEWGSCIPQNIKEKHFVEIHWYILSVHLICCYRTKE